MTEKPSSPQTPATASGEIVPDDVVIDHGKSQLSDLWKKEDSLAIRLRRRRRAAQKWRS